MRIQSFNSSKLATRSIGHKYIHIVQPKESSNTEQEITKALNSCRKNPNDLAELSYLARIVYLQISNSGGELPNNDILNKAAEYLLASIHNLQSYKFSKFIKELTFDAASTEKVVIEFYSHIYKHGLTLTTLHKSDSL